MGVSSGPAPTFAKVEIAGAPGQADPPAPTPMEPAGRAATIPLPRLEGLMEIVLADGVTLRVQAGAQNLVDEIQAVDVRIAELDRRMEDAARASEACRRLVEVPSIGPLSLGRINAEAAFQWRQGAPPRHQQPRRRLPASPARRRQ
jgi:hypothetical protein